MPAPTPNSRVERGDRLAVASTWTQTAARARSVIDVRARIAGEVCDQVVPSHAECRHRHRRVIQVSGTGRPALGRSRTRTGRRPVRRGDCAAAGARARKNYAGSAPITRASGNKTVTLARWIRNRRLADALHQQAFCALTTSPGRGLLRPAPGRGTGHHAALRQLSNRLGILHGCLKTGTRYDEATAWGHHEQEQRAAA